MISSRYERMELLRGRRIPSSKCSKFPAVGTLMAFRATLSYQACRWVACAKLHLRRWNSTNDWPAGLQFMPIKVQNYDVRASHRPTRQMAFLGFRSVSQDYKPIRAREDRATRRVSLRCVLRLIAYPCSSVSITSKLADSKTTVPHTERHVKTPTQP